jgi:hypothetical protein
VKLRIEKGVNFGPMIGFSTMTITLAHKEQSLTQFLTQISITEMEHPSYSPDFAPNDFWLFPK